MSNTTPPKFRKYRDLVEGERIEKGDQYRHELDDWRPTSAAGYIYNKTSHFPMRRPIQIKSIPMPTPTTPTHTYRILNDNKTKPVRCIVLINNKVYVEGVTRTVAREIVAGHMLRVHPDVDKEMREIVDHISSSGI